MKLIWTASSKPVSLLIRKVTAQPASHFAFVFTSAAKGLMFHSNFMGTHPEFFQTAKKGFDIVKEIEVDMPVELEDEIWDAVIQKYDGKKYDFGGAFFLAFSVLRERWFGIPRAKQNKWASDGAYFCNELYQVLGKIPGLEGVRTDDMDTPYDVWVKIEEHYKAAKN